MDKRLTNILHLEVTADIDDNHNDGTTIVSGWMLKQSDAQICRKFCEPKTSQSRCYIEKEVLSTQTKEMHRKQLRGQPVFRQ